MATDVIPQRTSFNADRRFFSTMALIVLLSTFLGFAPSYYLRGLVPAPHPYEALRPYVFFHGFLFSSWVILFLVQTLLVGAGRTDIHRRLGLVGMWLVAAMIPTALVVSVLGVGRPLTAAPGISPLSWMAVSFLDIPVFGGLIITALVKRRDSATHKRLMLVAMIDMMRPSLGRLLPLLGAPGPTPLLLPLLLLLPLPIFDLRTRGKIHPATLWGSLPVAAVAVLTLAIWTTPPWLAFASWLSRPFL
jgi:hypothetical protein